MVAPTKLIVASSRLNSAITCASGSTAVHQSSVSWVPFSTNRLPWFWTESDWNRLASTLGSVTTKVLL